MYRPLRSAALSFALILAPVPVALAQQAPSEDPRVIGPLIDFLQANLKVRQAQAQVDAEKIQGQIADLMGKCGDGCKKPESTKNADGSAASSAAK